MLRVPPIAVSFDLSACAAGGLTATYTMTGLGTLVGIIGEARAVNGSGDIVGGCAGDVFLVHHGKRTDLGRAEAVGVNGFGESAGSTSCCPALLISGGTSTLPGGSGYAGGISGAAGISHHHQVVGGSGNAQGYGHAVRGSTAAITGPGTPGGTPGAGSAVSDLGRVTGWAHTASEATRVLLCSGGTMTGLGTFGPDLAGRAGGCHRLRRLTIFPGRRYLAPGHAGFGPGDLRGRPRSADAHRHPREFPSPAIKLGLPRHRPRAALATRQVSAGVHTRNL